MIRCFVTLTLLTGIILVSGAARTGADDKKEPEVKKGTVVGVVTNKTEKSIEVKGEGSRQKAELANSADWNVIPSAFCLLP